MKSWMIPAIFVFLFVPNLILFLHLMKTRGLLKRDILSQKEFKASLDNFACTIAKDTEVLSALRLQLSKKETELKKKEMELKNKEVYLQEGAYQIFIDYIIDSVLTRDYLLTTPAFQKLIDPDYSNERYSRSLRDMESSSWIEDPFDVTAIVRDESGLHRTTLYHCDCDFYQRFHHPCTHMVRLAMEVGGAMCFAPSDENVNEIKLSKYSPWGNKIWVPMKNVKPK